MNLAICPGSFDPITRGHVDIIRRAANIFDKVIVLVLTNPNKNHTFDLQERRALIEKALGKCENIEIDSYCGLLADYAKNKGATAIVKGLRAMSDFEYEFQMALTNKKLYPGLETVFLTSSAENMYLSSSMVRQVALFGGDISPFVPPEILDDVNNVLKKYNKGGNQ